MTVPIRLLLVEDNEDDAVLLLHELTKGGFEPACERVQTLQQLQKALPAEEWDIVISDYSMPQFDGLAALKEVRRSSEDVPFILVSGTIGEDLAVAAMKAGAQDYLMKGNLARLASAVERELREAEGRRERRRSEQKLRQSEEQFRLISENVEDLIVVLDLEGNRLYSSNSYRNLLSDPSAEAGRGSFMDVHPEDRERVRELFRETVRTGIGQRAEYRFQAKDGSVRSVESQGSVIRDQQGAVSQIVVVSRDVTEKRKLEQQALRTQRMESIGTLAGGIAHDLNNVLSPIMMGIDILRRKYPGEATKNILDTLEASARRGSSMVKQVLTFARGAEGERILLQPAHLLEELKKIMLETFPKSVQVRTDPARELWSIPGDPTQIHQVLLNLCVNARDAMPNGGNLRLTAQNVQLDEQYAGMHFEARPGPYVAIEVADTGTGMPAGVIERMFEPFFTTKEVGKGTGLGLSTTLAIVRSHGGFINVYSEVGKGTTFRIHLPAQAGGSAADSGDVPSAEFPHGNGETVLVIDDEASIREITKETLEAYGYTVLTANDGTEGVALFAEHRRAIEVVLTDMSMPFMDGAATIRALRKLDPSLKIIAASGFSSNEPDAGNSLSELQAFLQKPYTAEKLLVTLRNVISAPRRSAPAG